MHIVELRFLPWWKITEALVAHGMPEAFSLPLVIAGKLVLDLTITFILSKIPAVKKLYGMKAW